jgi:hypothetical protein
LRHRTSLVALSHSSTPPQTRHGWADLGAEPTRRSPPAHIALPDRRRRGRYDTPGAGRPARTAGYPPVEKEHQILDPVLWTSVARGATCHQTPCGDDRLKLPHSRPASGWALGSSRAAPQAASASAPSAPARTSPPAPAADRSRPPPGACAASPAGPSSMRPPQSSFTYSAKNLVRMTRWSLLSWDLELLRAFVHHIRGRSLPTGESGGRSAG